MTSAVIQSIVDPIVTALVIALVFWIARKITQGFAKIEDNTSAVNRLAEQLTEWERTSSGIHDQHDLRIRALEEYRLASEARVRND